MAYYGDYYAGDPGLFGKIFGGVAKLAGGVIKTAVAATPIGRAVTAGLGALSSLGGAGRSASPAPGVVARAQAIRAVTRAPVRRAAARRTLSRFSRRKTRRR